MKALLKVSALLFGMLLGITAVSAAVEQADDTFGTEEFWTEMSQGE